MSIDARSKTCPVCSYEFPGVTLAVKLIAVALILLFLYLAFA